MPPARATKPGRARLVLACVVETLMMTSLRRACAGFHVVYHFFQLPQEANLGELDAVGARWCGTDWAEVDRARGRETQARTVVPSHITPFTWSQLYIKTSGPNATVEVNLLL